MFRFPRSEEIEEKQVVDKYFCGGRKMKRMMMLLAMVSLMSSMSVAAVVWNNDCSTLAGWGESSNAANEATAGGIQTQVWGTTTVFQMNSWWDNAGYTNIWTNTGVIIEANKDYTLTITMESFASSTPVTVALQDAANGWATFLQQSVAPAATWADNTLSFSTMNGANAGIVGGTIGLGISPGWWNNMAIDNIAITAVPEPVTLSLLGLGSLAALRRRK
jgi:hypothetical protein